MPPQTNKFLIAAGFITLIQAVGQVVVAVLTIAQYYCVIDFLRKYPLLIYIKILYFANPSSCDTQINIGQSIEDVADQAFVLITRESLTTYRTFVISCTSLGLSLLWMIGSIVMIRRTTHWPWVVTTILITVLDLIGFVTSANDVYYSSTLDDMMSYIGASASGLGSAQLDTRWAGWTVALIYSRFGVLLIINVCLTLIAIPKCNHVQPTDTLPLEERRNPEANVQITEKDSDQTTSSSSMERRNKIPRPGISRSFRTMKNFLFNKTESPRGSLDGGRNRQRVNFSADPSIESVVAAQQRRLTLALLEAAGRRSPEQRSRRLASSFNNPTESTNGGRGTNIELQAQKPWSYMPAANRMRDQLPPDEDLPPVPLPDYTAFQSTRKASVHRAASSLSSITQRKDYAPYQSPRPSWL